MTIDLEQAPTGDFRHIDCSGEFDSEFQLLRQTNRVEHDRQPRMIGRPAAELPKILGIAGHDDPILRHRTGEYVGIARTLQTDLVHMNRLVAVNGTKVMGQLRREVFVDQEARRHSVPLGRPRGGLARA